MTIDDKISDQKPQCSFNREAAKLSAASSEKIDKYEFITGEEILYSDQSRVIEVAKFTYSPFGKALEKQTKAIEEEAENPLKYRSKMKINQLAD